MRNLLHANDLDRLIAHLRGALLQEVAVGGRRLMALGEGQEAGSSCAVPANAVAAELLAQPEVRDADPAFADGVLDFVMAMADAPLPCRRAGLGGIELRRDDPADFEILTPFHRFTGDLSLGVIRQQLRGHVAGAVLHTGNLVEFRLGRYRNGVDVEDTIQDFAIARRGGSVVLSHESRIAGRSGWLRPRQVEAGTLRYEYEITAGSPVLRLTVSFAAAGQRVSKLRLSTALDQLGGAGLDMAEARIATGPAATPEWRGLGVSEPAGLTPGVNLWADGAPVSHLALAMAGWPEGAPTLHIRPQAPERVMNVKAVVARPESLHWLVLRHGPVRLSPGAKLVVREDRLLAAGTGAEDAARVMPAAAVAGDAMAGLDLDPLPPSGAALNAAATQLWMAARNAYRVILPAARVAALEGWFDRHMAALLAGQPALVDLANATLAAEARLRAGATAPLETLLGRLMARQTPGGGFEDRPGVAATLHGHALALLALARAAPHGDPQFLAGPIARALAVLRPGPVEWHDGHRLVVVEGLALEGASTGQLRAYAESIAMVARAASAVVLAGQSCPGMLPAAQAEALHRQAVALLRPLVRPLVHTRGAALEVLPSPLGGSSHPAALAAVVLGLMAPDAAILQQPVEPQPVPA